MTKYNQFAINGRVSFTTVDGEIFGVSGDANFIQSLYSAVNVLTSGSCAVSVRLTSGHVITKTA